MSSKNKISTIQLIIRNETFELSSYLFNKLIEYSSSSSSSDLFVSKVKNQNPIYLNIDPSIFNGYLVYIQSGCFIRPDFISQEDLINGLRICGAPFTLIHHYECCDLSSSLSSHEYSCHPINKKTRIKNKWLNIFILIGLFISTCILTIDLYRQILILNKNSYQETSFLLILIIYLIDVILFLYSFLHGILKYFLKSNEEKQFKSRYPDLFVDIISCIGILSYFAIQYPLTNIYLTRWNSLWIFIHMCRTIRLIQIGYRLIDIQWCLYAITQCFPIFFQTILGIFWLFIFSGSILYTMDMIEQNEQYSTMYLTILSAHETLYTIGYRNNAPYGCLTRLWTIISIYLMSSIVQILLWWFQTKVSIQWKILLNKQN